MSRWDLFRIVLVLSAAMLSNGEAGVAQTAAPLVTVLEAPAIKIPSSQQGGSAMLKLKNTSDKPQTLSLSADDLIRKDTREKLPATITFKPKEAKLDANSIADIEVSVAGMYAEGEAEALIRSGGVQLGTLQIFRYPIDVTLAGGPEYLFERGSGPFWF